MLDELFDIALDFTVQGQETEVQLVISEPVPGCKLVAQLKLD
jgi:hypothetical protein